MSIPAIFMQPPQVNTPPAFACCGRFSLDWDACSAVAAVISLISSIASFIFTAQHHLSIIARGVVRSVVRGVLGNEVVDFAENFSRRAVRNLAGGLFGSLIYSFFSSGAAPDGAPPAYPDEPPLDDQPVITDFESLLGAAENGDVNAQALVANCYGTGQGVSSDLHEAVRWCRLAAKQRHADAQLSTGMSYALGRGGMRQNYHKAIKWFQRAAENGCVEALNKLGDFLTQGILHAYERGFQAYQMAAAQNDPEGTFKVGLCFAKGWGTAQDFQEAAQWFKRADELGYAKAKMCAHFYEDKISPPQDLNCTFTVDFQDNAILIHCDQDVVSTAAGYCPEAVAYCKMFGYAGLEPSCRDKLHELVQKQDYVEVLKYVWTESSKDEVIRFLEVYAEEKHPILMLELSRALCQQNNSPKNIKQALRWYMLGMLYTALDLGCNNDLSTLKAFDLLGRAYHPHRVFSLDWLQEFLDKNRKFVKELQALFQNFILKGPSPSPRWLVYHGTMVTLLKNSLLPEIAWNEARLRALETFKAEFLPRLNQFLGIDEGSKGARAQQPFETVAIHS